MNAPTSFLLLLLAFVAVAAAQLPIPTATAYHTIGNHDAPIQLEAFMDFQCPDSKAAWPVMKQLMTHYGPGKLLFRFSVFPLPYHHNAMFASQASLVAINITQRPEVFWPMTETLFGNQDQWGDVATQGISPLDVINMLAGYASSCCGVNPGQFKQHMGWVSPENLDARVAWKYAASRGVYGTPMFSVNGVILPDAQSTWTLSDWQAILDPLL